MRINSINPIIFKAKIIDSHCHIGQWNEGDSLKNYTQDLDLFVKSSLDNGDTIEKVIVSNMDCMARTNSGNFLSDEITGNKKLAEIAKSKPKIVPLATCQPGYGSVDNIRRLFQENPTDFIGLKFHPEQLNIVADNFVYEPYIKFAKDNNLPCLFHSGSSKVSNPIAIQNLAKKFPEVEFIIAHWGAECGGDYSKVTEIIIDSVKNKNSIIYADISWVDCNDSAKPNLKEIIKRLKEENALDRILFGSDAPLGRFSAQGENGISPMKAYTQMVDDIKNMVKKEFPENEAEEILDKIFYRNSEKLFLNRTTSTPHQTTPKPTPKPIRRMQVQSPSQTTNVIRNEVVQTISKNKIGKALAISFGALVAGLSGLKYVNNKRQMEGKPLFKLFQNRNNSFGS